MVRRVIRVAIVAWLVGAGVQWARRQGRSLAPLGRVLGGRAKATPSRSLGSGSARARLSETAAREGTSAHGSGRAVTGPATEAMYGSPGTTETMATGAAVDVSSGDDLKVIEGIGPRFEAVLSGAGVVSFTKLAALDKEAIQTIIREAGARVADPSTWPEQARLAARGEWEALVEMQARLKGGREDAAD